MRILGYIDHPVLKITVFKTDTRLAVKFEDRLLEQTYKFPMQQQLNSLAEVRQLVEQQLVDFVMQNMQTMREQQMRALDSLPPVAGENEFEEII